MRQVETHILVLLLVFGMFGVGLSVCRDFMKMDESGMAGPCRDRDHCQKACRSGLDEAPAVHERIQLQVSFNAAAVWVHHSIPPLSPRLHLLHDLLHGASPLEVDGKISTGEVYLQNASFLI